jgi:hypothetical protein
MIEITALITICKSALSGGSALYDRYRKRAFSSEEHELLINAAREGCFYILHTSIYGSWVRAGTKDFFQQSDRAYQAFYMDAFRSLCQRGYVVHEGGHLSVLTGAGFRKARELTGDQTALPSE